VKFITVTRTEIIFKEQNIVRCVAGIFAVFLAGLSVKSSNYCTTLFIVTVLSKHVLANL